jgi:hypothetical protein
VKKLLLALGLLLPLSSSALSQGPIVGPGQPIICTKVATIPPGGPAATLTQLVAAVAGQSISVCGWHITNTAAAGTFSFSYGTGAACGTGTQTPFPAQSVTSNAPSADHSQYASVTVPVSNALCYTFSVNTLAGIVYYVQF